MTLFVAGDFKSHSGLILHEKIECDALTPADLDCLAQIIHRHAWPWSRAIGIPFGGVPLATVLNLRYKRSDDAPVLVVDDVLTTGKSLIEAMGQYANATGFVIFDRSGKPLPPGVKAIFTMIA